MPKEWESAHRNFHMQAEASLGFAHSKKPPIYSPSKANSSAPTLHSDIKSLPRLQPSRPPDTSGAPTQVTDAKPERYFSTPRRPPIMASSSTTNGTNTPTTVNSDGTQQLDELKYTPYEISYSTKNSGLTTMPPSGTDVTMASPPLHKPSKFRPITNNASSHGTPPSHSPRNLTAS